MAFGLFHIAGQGHTLRLFTCKQASTSKVSESGASVEHISFQLSIECFLFVLLQVTLEEVRPGESPDGLTLGVTATSPDALPNDSPATLEHIPETWHASKVRYHLSSFIMLLYP